MTVSRAWLATSLGLAIAGSIVAWQVVLRSEAPPVAHARPHDDFELLPGDFERARIDASPPDRDLLAATGSSLVYASAADRTLALRPKTGGPARVIARLDRPATGLAVDGADAWCTTAGPGGARLLRVTLAGGEVHVVAEGLARPHDLARSGPWVVVVDEDASSPGLSRGTSVERFAEGGGGRTVLGRSDGAIENVAVDGTTVYWADALEGTLVAAPLAGGASWTIATERGLPSRVALSPDGHDLVWVEKRGETLWQMPATGGAPHAITQDFAGFAAVAPIGGAVFWVNESAVDGGFRVLRAPLSGGDVTAVSPLVPSIDALTTDGAVVFWAHEGAVGPVASEPGDAR